ncbi:MAG: hypothetical protein EHM41_16630 [Chloroflexi bacterium]|nr:MAG: hypothetical protein EHM41_16630 [Chloroflexota bacterium]
MDEETTYEIRIQGVLDEKWADYFEPFLLTTGQEGTILTGVVHDQGELFGVLLKIRDLGIRLVSLKPIP